MGLPGCMFVCLLILLLVFFYFSVILFTFCVYECLVNIILNFIFLQCCKAEMWTPLLRILKQTVYFPLLAEDQTPPQELNGRPLMCSKAKLKYSTHARK